MQEVIEATKLFITGAALGIACGYIKMPIPAPPTVTGVIGILGVTLGYILTAKYIGR